MFSFPSIHKNGSTRSQSHAQPHPGGPPTTVQDDGMEAQLGDMEGDFD